MTTTPDYRAYEAKLAAAGALEAEILPLNKTAIFDVLASTEIQTVTIAFDGYGNNGKIESIAAQDAAGGERRLPNTAVQVREVSFEEPAITVQDIPLSEAITAIVLTLLEQTHTGWENGDGAFGEVTFDVPLRSIALDYNERYTESTNHLHMF
jgi:hypothetical protein